MQGIGGSGMFSMTMVIALSVLPPEKQGIISGVIGIVMVVSGILGPVRVHLPPWLQDLVH